MTHLINVHSLSMTCLPEDIFDKCTTNIASVISPVRKYQFGLDTSFINIVLEIFFPSNQYYIIVIGIKIREKSNIENKCWSNRFYNSMVTTRMLMSRRRGVKEIFSRRISIPEFKKYIYKIKVSYCIIIKWIFDITLNIFYIDFIAYILKYLKISFDFKWSDVIENNINLCNVMLYSLYKRFIKHNVIKCLKLLFLEF